jgi:hypothetical protein
MQAELEAAYCWEANDHVPSWPDMTGLRRAMRWHHARWREERGFPIGTHPFVPRPGDVVRPVGNRLPVEYGRDTGATFVTPAALAAARDRMAVVERHQSIDHQRLWADLLASEALAFNLCGDLAGDLAFADRAVHTWWPDTPGTVCDVRFHHSPGRLDPGYLNSLRQFDVAVTLDLGDGTFGILAIDVKYHEHMKPETPKPENAHRNLEVLDRSGVFDSAARALTARSALCEPWLEHLLLLSMLQHESQRWRWAHQVVVHPAGRGDMIDLFDRYRAFLADDSTWSTTTLESLLAAGALPRSSAAALSERYLLQ